MDSLFKRALAYALDMLLITFVYNSIITSPVNIQLEDYQDYYEQYEELRTTYNEQQKNDITTCKDLEEAIKDKKLTEEEYVLSYEDLVKEKEKIEEIENGSEEEENLEESGSTYEEKCLAIVDKYNNNKIEYNDYVKSINNYSKHLEQNMIVPNIILIILCIAYFVFFQGFTNGQTLGKKLMRLKVVGKEDKDVSYMQLFIRSLFLFEIVYMILRMLSAVLIPLNYYPLVYNTIYILNILLTLVIAFTIGFNKDRRGLHDIVAHTRVIMMDFKGNEIKDRPFFKKETKDKKIEEKEETTKELKKETKSKKKKPKE